MGLYAGRKPIAAGAAALALAASAAAPASAQDIPGYDHTHWSLADGAPSDIRAIAQTPDGYLWLGSGDGLYRFDGITFERVDPVDFDPFRSRQVTALATARDGSLWVGYDFGGVAVYRHGRLRGANPGKPKGSVTDIVAAPDGSVWVGVGSGFGSQLRHYAKGRWDVMEVGRELPAGLVMRIYLARDGTLWLAMFKHLYRLPPGSRHPVEVPVDINTGPDFAEDGRGRLWLYSSSGLARLTAKAGVPAGVKFGAMIYGGFGQRELHYIPRDDSLWIVGDQKGIERVSAAAPRQAEARVWPSRMTTLFRDREGTLWGGATDGLERFVASPFLRLAEIGDAHTAFVRGGHDGKLYIGGDRGLYRIEGDTARMVLPSLTVHDACSVPGRGIYVFTGKGEFLIDADGRHRIFGPREKAAVMGQGCAADGDGTLWQAVPGDGVYRLRGRDWQREERWPPAMQMLAIGRGTLIASRPLRMVARLDSQGTHPLLQGRQIGVGFVKLLARDGGHLYVGGEAGIMRIENGHVALLDADRYPWLVNVMGIVRHKADVWLVTGYGIVRVAEREWNRAFAHPGYQPHIRRFRGDGSIRARTGVYVAGDAAMDETGRLWFATSAGVIGLDPDRLPMENTHVPTRIGAIEADNRHYSGANPQLPAGTDRIDIAYAGLSLADARSNRYRYRLDGIDGDWVDAGTRRRVSYSGLLPGSYRFHVQSARADSVWSSPEAAVSFTILPHFWQTWWFRAGAMLLAAATLAAIVRWRLSITVRELQSRVEERVAERERIARDLHDTLLQGFQGLMLRFQSVLHQIPAGSTAREAMQDALECADDVLLEGRERVHNLRQESAPQHIAAMLECSASRILGEAMEWRIAELGEPRKVAAPVADEVVMIANEALTNSLRHSGARRVDIEIHHRRNRMDVRIVDDGAGLPEDVREAGFRQGHFGLAGMRERAQLLGGMLAIANAAGGGTSVRVAIPSSIAYG